MAVAYTLLDKFALVLCQNNKNVQTTVTDVLIGVNKLGRLWLCWQSSCFQYQRSAARIQSLAKFYTEHSYTVNCIEKTKIKYKRPGIPASKSARLMVILVIGVNLLIEIDLC